MAVDEQMKGIDRSMEEFLNTVSKNFNGIMGKISSMKDNMVKIKQENRDAKQELGDLRLSIKKGDNPISEERIVRGFKE